MDGGGGRGAEAQEGGNGVALSVGRDEMMVFGGPGSSMGMGIKGTKLQTAMSASCNNWKGIFTHITGDTGVAGGSDSCENTSHGLLECVRHELIGGGEVDRHQRILKK